jgi:hypothetical protein
MSQGASPSPHDHADLAARLDWLRRLLAWQVAVTRQTFGALAGDEYRGLYIPDAEADVLGGAPAELPAELAAEREALDAERAALDALDAGDASGGAAPPLRRVAALFGLDAFARDVLLLALAPELDLRFERLYAYVQDDVTKKRPSVDLALRLLCRTPGERLARRAAFAADAPLARHRLVHLFEDGQRHPPLLARFLKLDDRVVAELAHDGAAPAPGVDAAIAPFAALGAPARRLDALVVGDELAARLRDAVAAGGGGLVLALQGGYGSGRRAVAEALCAAAGLPLLAVRLDALVRSDADGAAPGAGPPLAAADAVQRVVREATLRGAAVLWQGADRVLADDAPAAWREALLGALDDFRGRSFLALEKPWEARGQLRRTTFLRVELPAPSYGDRERLWRARLNGDGPGDATLQALASTFRLTGGQIRDAAAMARAAARWRAAGATARVDPQELYAACRAQSSGRLGALAQKVPARYAWDDIVLPADQVSQLREVCLQVRHRRTVLERWGFDRHLAMGKGVNVLLAGPSGTGKTMAAEIVAADLGLELYKVDLSTMVSKYIGETEKNLEQVFAAGREANAILFFDEADALFGKRSEVKDAHDRYANIEVGYLLQKMEEYDGVVVLATNLRKNLDDAFVRRLHVAVEFAFPEAPDRERIWRKVFPPDAPVAADVDAGELSRRFKLAGGNIRNVALLAAYLAAEDGGAITLGHVIRATKREYQKLGKLLTEGEFGPHLALAKG